MALTDTAVRQSKADRKPYKRYDERGMYLLVTPSGGRLWRLKYRYGGKEKTLALGAYPDVSLKRARERRDDARRLLADGRDPAAQKKAEKAAQAAKEATLETLGREWLAAQNWASNYGEKVEGRLRRHIFPLLGHRPITEITAPDLLVALRRIEKAGNIETARRAKQHVSRIYRFAIAAGQVTHNPAEGLEEALVAKPRAKHFAAVTDPDKLGALLRAIDGYNGTPEVSAALRLVPLLFVRPGELRRAEWAEVDLDGALWEIPSKKMKTGRPHLVSLSTQALDILHELRPWTERSRYVFPGRGNRPMSDAAMTAAFRRMGYSGDEVTAHGFRATARTLLDETLDFRPDWIEHQLAHAVRDANGRAYNRTTFLNERRQMMQAWADYLEALKAGKPKIVPMRA